MESRQLKRLTLVRQSRLHSPGRRFASLILAAAVASACGLLPGDESEYVYFHNTLEVAVSVGTRGDDPSVWRLVQPGETAMSQWLVPGLRDGKRKDSELPLRQVEAKTESGTTGGATILRRRK